MSTSVHIQPATARDIETLAALLSELNHEEGYETSVSADALRAALVDGRVTMRALVAEAERHMSGMVLYYWGYDTVSASHGYHLADIIVTASHRRQGVGRMLFTALATQCLGEGGKWISLTTLKKNALAHQFYRSCGMSEVAVNFFAIGPQALARCAQPK